MIPQPMRPDRPAGQLVGLEAPLVPGDRVERRLAIDDVAELLAGVAKTDEHQRQRPLGDAVRRAVRRVDGPDAALPGRLDVDPAGEPVALQLADEPQVRAGVHDLAGDARRRRSRR